MIRTPKCKGGLGFKKLDIMNNALLMKNTWWLITEPTKLSNQVLLTKYGVQLDEIALVHPPTDSHGVDSFFWGVSFNGIFFVKSAYELLDDPIGNGDHNFWRLAWSWKGSHSIRVFLWLLLHGRLKTRKELNRRHLALSTQCDICGGPVEDILHTLRDCVTARRMNLMRNTNDTSQEYWRVCFGVAVWRLWLWRNGVLFNHGSWDSGFIATDIKARTQEILRCIHQLLHGKQQRVETLIRWKAPIWSCVSLNMDDSNGNWLMGFTVNLGICSVLSVELWGLLHGLRVAWEYGFRPNEDAILVKAIRELLARDWIIHMEHVYKEANSVADFLASYSLTTPIGLNVLLSPPPAIVGLLCNYAYGIAHSRLVLH
ncbi:putative ribonuclease H protein [Citrus sinensis]|nr:putative ribonuclease H protein [Citrus sinensis]